MIEPPGDSQSAAVQLLLKWLTTFDTNESTKERLKIKVNVLNAESCGIPAWALKYNGHGCMLTKSNRMTRLQGRTKSGLECSVVECDVDLREWNLLCRQGVNSILPILGNIDFTLALIIQGESDNELPEQVLGLVRLNFLDLERAQKW